MMTAKTQLLRKEKNDLKNALTLELNNVSHYLQENLRTVTWQLQKKTADQKATFQKQLIALESDFHTQLETALQHQKTALGKTAEDIAATHATALKEKHVVVTEHQSRVRELEHELENTHAAQKLALVKHKTHLDLEWRSRLDQENKEHRDEAAAHAEKAQTLQLKLAQVEGELETVAAQVQAKAEALTTVEEQVEAKKNGFRQVLGLLQQHCDVPSSIVADVSEDNVQLMTAGARRLEEFLSASAESNRTEVETKAASSAESEAALTEARAELNHIHITLQTRTVEYEDEIEALRQELDNVQAENLLTVELSKVQATQTLKNELETLRASLVNIEMTHEEEIRAYERETDRKLREQKEHFEDLAKIADDNALDLAGKAEELEVKQRNKAENRKKRNHRLTRDYPSTIIEESNDITLASNQSQGNILTERVQVELSKDTLASDASLTMSLEERRQQLSISQYETTKVVVNTSSVDDDLKTHERLRAMRKRLFRK
jgi:hypothetical protein